jgi:glycosyltransferase involved in cell wall biosynthesis
MRILFLCDFARPFSAAEYRGAGVGGTEAAVVLMAEALAAAGHEVSVAVAGGGDAVERGVRWLPLTSARLAHADAAVLVKRWTDAAERVAAPRRVFFATDVHVADSGSVLRALHWAGQVLLMSEYQRACLERALPGLGGRPATVVGLPVDVAACAAPSGEREPVLLYCSVPDRGLHHLARVFPAVRRQVPGARLVITSDFTLWGAPAARPRYLPYFRGIEGVDYRGRVDRAELLALQASARVLAYPCTFPEGFCLAAAECMAAGCVPVTSDAFALPETVGAGGVLVGGRPGGWLYRRRFAAALVRLLRDGGEWARRSRAVRADALARFDPAAHAARLLRVVAAAPSPVAG